MILGSRPYFFTVETSHLLARDCSQTFAMVFKSSTASPRMNRLVVPARQAYSHSASVGSRYVRPSFLLSHAQNATASCQFTLTTGWLSFCGWPGSRHEYFALPYSKPRDSAL